MKDIELPPLPPACGAETLSAIGWGYTEDDMQAYARAAVEANSVPDGYREVLSNLLWAATERDAKNRIRQFDEFLDAARSMLASTPAQPAQQERKPMTDEMAASDYFGRSEAAANPENRTFTNGSFECFLGGIRFAERRHGIKE